MSNAVNIIRLLKQGLRQICLTDTKHWPEALPSVLQGINASPLYNSAATREQLFFSPLSHVNTINMAQTHIPELIFNTQFLRLRALKEKRQKILKRISNLDPTQYFKGNLILAVNHPSPAKLDSKELEQTTRGVYFIKRVFPTHLRLIDIFTGATRSLPKKFCFKVKLDD